MPRLVPARATKAIITPDVPSSRGFIDRRDLPRRGKISRGGKTGGNLPQISLGVGTDPGGPIFGPVPGLSTVFDAADVRAQIAILREAARQSPTHDAPDVAERSGSPGEPVMATIQPDASTPDQFILTTDSGQTMVLSRAAAQDFRRQNPTVAVTDVPFGTPPTRRDNMPLDLGSLAGDLLRQAGTAAINRAFAGPARQQFVGGPVQAQPAFDLNPFDAGSALDLTGVVCPTRKRRRRRKRVATASDIKDLASLKAVLTPAELKTWIATHPA